MKQKLNYSSEHDLALATQKTLQEYETRGDSAIDFYGAIWILPQIVALSLGYAIAYFFWSDSSPWYVNHILPMVLSVFAVVVSLNLQFKTPAIQEAVENSQSKMTEDEQLEGGSRISSKLFAQQTPATGAVARMEQRSVFERVVGTKRVFNKKTKRYDIVLPSGKHNYEVYEATLYQKFGLGIKVSSIPTEEQIEEEKAERKRYSGKIDGFSIADMKETNMASDAIHISLNNKLSKDKKDELEAIVADKSINEKVRKDAAEKLEKSAMVDKELAYEGLKEVQKADVLLPLSQFKTHLYIQGRAGTGKSVLYSKFIRATMGLPLKPKNKVDLSENKRIIIQVDQVVIKLLKERSATRIEFLRDMADKDENLPKDHPEYGIAKKRLEDAEKRLEQAIQDTYEALKCKTVIIDTKGNLFSKYYRGKFSILNHDGTYTDGEDIMYAGGLDSRSVAYDFSSDLVDLDGKLDRLAVNNFAEFIFKTAEITDDAAAFWAVNGKNIARAAIQAIFDDGPLTNKTLYNWLKSDKLIDLIQNNSKAKLIAGAAIDGDSANSERILGLLSGITQKAVFLEWIATDRESKGTLSFKRWFNDGVPGCLFLVATDELVDILMPLYGIISSFMLEAVFIREDS